MGAGLPLRTFLSGLTTGPLRLIRALAPVLLLALFVGTLLSASPVRAQSSVSISAPTTAQAGSQFTVTVYNLNPIDGALGILFIDSAASSGVNGISDSRDFSVTILSSGTHTISYGLVAASPFSSTTIEITPASLTPRTVSAVATPSSLTFSQTSSLSFSGPGGGTPVYSTTASASVCTISGNILTAGNTAGSCPVTVQVGADGTYEPATSAALPVSVSAPAQVSQTITVSVSNTSLLYNGTATLSASGYSGTGAITYATTGSCSITGTTLTAGTSAGTCSVTAKIEADATYAAANSSAVTVSVSAPAPASQTITVNVSNTSLLYNGIATLSASGYTGTGAITYATTGSCSITGTTLTAGTSAGTCSVTAKIEADSGHLSATSSAVTVTVSAPASASQTITVHVSKTSLYYNGTATLSASGYTGTGAITYETTVLCSITGTTLKAGSGAGGCAVTAKIAADATHLAATSAAVIVTIDGRSAPTSDPSVLQTMQMQTSFSSDVITDTIDAVSQRLAGSVVADWTVEPPSASAAYAPNEPGGFGMPRRAPAVAALDKKAKAAPAKHGASPEPDYKIWTAGSLITDVDRVQGVPDKTRATRQAMTVGLDTRLSEGLIAGMAFSGFTGESKFDDFGSKQRALAWTGAAYGSLKLIDGVFLDSVLGYGDARFKSTRYNANAAGLLTGSRNGDMVFGALRVSWNQKAGQLRYAPYVRLDFSHVWFDKYAEQGDANWNLAFDKSTVSSQAFVLGFRTQYDIANGNGVISPTLRVEYRHTFNGDMTQTMNYVADPASRYSLTLDGSKRDAVTGAIGLKAQGDGALSGQIEYSAGMALQGGGFAGQGLRGSIRLGF